MAEWNEKCLTCRKSNWLINQGWMWACDEPECQYEAEEVGTDVH